MTGFRCDCGKSVIWTKSLAKTDCYFEFNADLRPEGHMGSRILM
jgi:hypothetical protein